ncbi:hypothetical protein F3J23_16865 [Chryseobacterium sp. Tr-659]|uniref:hypothetical protein n=1 Tax=Chryseobacterium sp. Tr-659 TaxID=2608340 RepID=UPI00141DA77C|nr:hypothetical protein [Chryseobacterium sp. Tr-659]NIF07111.1 hypothetical protein [Chryseobacterium sp. Tr-659]
MQEDQRKEFLPLISKPSWWMTGLTRVSGLLLLLVALLVILGLPLVLSKSITILVVVSILYYPLLALGLYRFFLHQKAIRKRMIRNIIVDDQGIHYERADGTIHEILYHNLETCCFSDKYDVSYTTINKTYVLKVNDKGSITEVDFDGMDAGYIYYISNLRVLRRRFIQGIVRFRPDLNINPFVYTVFYINPLDFTWDRKEFWTDLLKTGGVMILVVGIVASFILLAL